MKNWFFSLFKKRYQRPAMYILLRQDLSIMYKNVQAAHALAQYAIEYPEQFKLWNNQLIFLGVRNLIELKEWNVKLGIAGVQYSYFTEPDLDGQLTAIAYYGTGEIFKKLNLA